MEGFLRRRGEWTPETSLYVPSSSTSGGSAWSMGVPGGPGVPAGGDSADITSLGVGLLHVMVASEGPTGWWSQWDPQGRTKSKDVLLQL